MKKILLLGSALFLSAGPAFAQLPYIEEVKALGAIGGQGMACGSTRYATYEMLARAIMLTKAPNVEIMNQGIYAYSEAKADAYISKQMDGFFECAQINRRFDNQLIFRATLYADGTIKMPDGKIIKPFRPYDAARIYDTSAPEIGAAQSIYAGKQRKINPQQLNPQITSLKPEARPRYENAVSDTGTKATRRPSAPQPSSIKRISRRQ